MFRCRCNAIAVKKLVQSNCRLLSLLKVCAIHFYVKAILVVEQTVARNIRISCHSSSQMFDLINLTINQGCENDFR